VNRFENPIVVRTLNTVGGDRPGKRMSRRLNRIARKQGFATWAQFVQACILNRNLFAAIQNIASRVEQQQQ